jgi:endonuclease YncB( thermonuclease family)
MRAQFLLLTKWCAMGRAWSETRGRLRALTFAVALCAGPASLAAAQEGGRPATGDVAARKVIRTQRLRVPADLFERDTVLFKHVRVDANGTIRADGHNLDFYGAVLIRRDRICASPEGARWACGQRAFMAMRQILEGQSISCSFVTATGAPKAVCWVGDNDVMHSLLSQGWAELADGVTNESYVEAAVSARRRKVGIWADGPP